MNSWSANQKDVSTDFLSNYDEIKAPAPMPNGTYYTTLNRMEPGQARNGSPYVKFSFKVLDGEYAGRIVQRTTYWSEAAAPHSKVFCSSLGVDPRKSLCEYPPIYAEVLVENKEGQNGLHYADVIRARRVEMKQTIDPESSCDGILDNVNAGIPGVM